MAGTLIIGGTAAYHLEFERLVTVNGERMIETPFGEAGPVVTFRVDGQDCAFLSRHGGQGRLGVTPPFINYRANVWLARELGAARILSWNSAGSMVRSLEPGSLAVVADIIDWTRARPATFGGRATGGGGSDVGSDGGGSAASSGRVTAPPPCAERAPGPLFDHDLRQALVRAAAACGHKASAQAIYAGTEGARLETAAEIALLAAAGAELVGMTMAPEVFLANELGLTYGSLCWVSNYATGLPFDGPEQRLFGAEVGPMMLEIMLTLLKEESRP